VLTDADIGDRHTIIPDKSCGDCRECTDICPVKAIKGRNFREDEPREARYDARRCEKYLKGLEASTGYGVCGMCLYTCPYGKKFEK
jgi:epoxyqueuosine reductase QueG